MGGFREEMREARMDLHEEMSVPGLYMLQKESPDPINVTVRVFEYWNALGDLKGTNFNYAEIQDMNPRMVFLASEVEPVRGAFVSIESGEVYRVDNVLPNDDITVLAKMIKLEKKNAQGFRLPGWTPPPPEEEGEP